MGTSRDSTTSQAALLNTLSPGSTSTFSEAELVDTQQIAARLGVLLAPRYTVLKLIGIGGMASVYLVRHRIHHGLFAVKVMHPGLVEQPELLARFLREGLLTARLAGHPGIVPLIDICEGDGLHYLVMAYVRGEDLDHLLTRSGPLCLRDAVLTISQVNVVHLHTWRHGILHCDLTPGNIRLNNFGQFILMDFGLADVAVSSTAASDATSRSSVLLPMANPRVVLAPQIAPKVRRTALAASILPRPGTPLYTSPERILGNEADVRSDLYALGAIFYELLTGEALFGADDATIPSDIPGTLRAIEQKHLASTRILTHPALRAHPGVLPLLHSLVAFSLEDRIANPLALKQALECLTPHTERLSIHPEHESLTPSALRRKRLFF